MAYVRPKEASSGPSSTHRSGRPQQESHGFFSRLFPSRAPEAATSTPQPRAERPMYNLQDYLPPPVEDRTIQQNVDAAREHLHNHVEVFYINATTDLSAVHTQADMPGLSQHDTPEPPLADQVSVKSEVKRVIATRVIRGIQPFDRSDEAGSLLPHEITEFLDKVPDPANVKNDHAYASALSQWRVLSWYLLSHAEIRDENERIFEKRLERQVQSLVVNLEEQLQPYVDKSKDGERRREHLAQLIRLIAGLGRNISAQPASYEFSWDYVPDNLEDPKSESQEARKGRRTADEGSRSRMVYDFRVLFPALLKKNNSPGPRSHRRICVCEPDVETLQIKPLKRRTTGQVTVRSADR